MPLSMAVTVIRKLTTAHRYYVKIPDTEPHRNRSQEMWNLGYKFSYAITYTSPIFMKVTPARQLYVNNFYTEFHENLPVTTSQRTGGRMVLVST
jgi:hypothetical protein